MRNTSFSESEMSLIDKLIYHLRIRPVRPHLTGVDCFVDIGCDYDAKLLRTLIKKYNVSKAVGIDLIIDPNIKNPKLRFEQKNINTEKINLANEEADMITALALIEHLDTPEHLLNESFRILKHGGKLILTTPSPWAKPILDFLAHRLRIISRREIDDHKNYFNKEQLLEMLLSAGFKENKIKIRSFLFGFNNLVCCVKD